MMPSLFILLVMGCMKTPYTPPAPPPVPSMPGNDIELDVTHLARDPRAAASHEADGSDGLRLLQRRIGVYNVGVTSERVQDQIISAMLNQSFRHVTDLRNTRAVFASARSRGPGSQETVIHGRMSELLTLASVARVDFVLLLDRLELRDVQREVEVILQLDPDKAAEYSQARSRIEAQRSVWVDEVREVERKYAAQLLDARRTYEQQVNAINQESSSDVRRKEQQALARFRSAAGRIGQLPPTAEQRFAEIERRTAVAPVSFIEGTLNARLIEVGTGRTTHVLRVMAETERPATTVAAIAGELATALGGR